ncbi:hypothetical protein HPB49_021005 [Dermacentor silvarum]|uniref:Uncharacterized protein n=1 Tax=Dermacentor silvarum TaxID=543639 RepID=A0ACB8D881_DERSI|nr:hypothetical protein HPB49_021005 [Dermacentor silvarum]
MRRVRVIVFPEKTDKPMEIIVHCSSVIVLRTCVEEDTVSEVLSRFWDLESLGVRADEESLLDSELTLQEFEKNITKRDGRYQVRLPWNKTEDLADNFSVATKRLGNLMGKLSKDRSLLERGAPAPGAEEEEDVSGSRGLGLGIAILWASQPGPIEFAKALQNR